MARPTPSGGMIRFRFEGFFPRVGKSRPTVRMAPLSWVESSAGERGLSRTRNGSNISFTKKNEPQIDADGREWR